MKKICSIIVADNYQDEINPIFFSQLSSVIESFGITDFFIGTDRGVELNILSYLVKKKESFVNLNITAVIASERSLINWDESQRDYFFNLITHCDKELLLVPPIEALTFLHKELVMIDIADLVILAGIDNDLFHILKKKGKRLLRYSFEKESFIPSLSVVN